MFEASQKARQFKRGEIIEGTIVAIGPKVAFVDIGGKGEAEIDVAELKDADGDIEVSVGERITAMVVSTSGGIALSRKGVRNTATLKDLEDAYAAGLAVEGKVVQEVKGGYEVRVARGPSTGSGSPRAQSSGERAFCPLSQIDTVRTDPSTTLGARNAAVHVGQVYRFKVIEFKEGGRNIIVSRRRQLEEEQRANADEIRKSIVPGAVVTGRVVSVPDFGAFVDLGGVQGLLHVSEMSWTRITNPNEVVAPGDQITVRVLRVDEATGKIALGLKQLQDDPWTAAGTKFPVGQVRTGRVSRIAEFGVFVELEPGFTALLPLAETGTDRGADIRKAFPIGSDVEVVVLEVDAPARRVRVSKRAVAEQREQAELRDYTDRQSAAPSESMGSIADKLRDALGRRE